MTIERHSTTADISVPDHAVVVADASLPARLLEGFEAPIEVAAGEGLKRLERVEHLAERVLARRASKPLTIVAVGGGSVGDAVGFLASILWRGVELWHVPTTLLAMVDSAHGGKTAVNLGQAKNQLGTFHAAERVILVEECLETLPLEQRRDGLVELVKGLWLGDAEALDILERAGGVDALAAAPFGGVDDRLMRLVRRAIEVKLEVVDRDPYERRGIRTILNLGHTVGHALELEAGERHGQAVAWGLLACGWLSRERGRLSDRQAERLSRHVYPLVDSAARAAAFDDRAAFEAALARDKKRVDGRLRSVLLDGPAAPDVSEAPTAAEWWESLRRAVDWYRGTPVRVERSEPRGVALEMAASKSELNRALTIAHLRPGRTEVIGDSTADDVRALRRGLEGLADASGPVTVASGEGGTTARFLLAVAATRPEPTTIVPAASLWKRPHGALIEALVEAGADIECIETSQGAAWRVEGWSSWPDELRVDASQSSQFASALALLAAGGRAFELVVEGHADDSEMPSRPYFEMTLEFLERAGVEVERQERRVALSPDDRLERSVRLRAEADASSAAVWSVARWLGCEVTVTNRPTAGRQPDAGVDQLLERLPRPDDESADERIDIDVADRPDLVPVLTVAALDSPAEVRLHGAAHLRFKEADRIGDLADTLARVGLEVEEREDGLRIPAGRQRGNREGRWPTHGDHRLAMAGLVASLLGEPLTIATPGVVTKSYPELWHHARRAGWQIHPVD